MQFTFYRNTEMCNEYTFTAKYAFKSNVQNMRNIILITYTY